MYRSSAILLQIDALLEAPLLKEVEEFLLHALLHLIGQDDLVGDVEVAKLVLVVHTVAVLVPLRHTLSDHRLDVTALDDVTSFTAKTDNVGVEMCEVARPLAHPGLTQRQHLDPVQVIALAAEESTVVVVGVVVARGGALG